MPELPRQVNAALRAPLLELIPSALRANPASFSPGVVLLKTE